MTHPTESERGLPEFSAWFNELDFMREYAKYGAEAAARTVWLAAIEKDRAERSEAVAWLCEDTGDIEHSHKPWMNATWKPLYTEPPERIEAVPVAESEVDAYLLRYMQEHPGELSVTQLPALRAFFTNRSAPPERSDVQGAEIDYKALYFESQEMLTQIRMAFNQTEAWPIGTRLVDAVRTAISRPAVQQEGFEPFPCISPACGDQCSDCNMAISPQHQRDYAIRYAYLRQRPVESIALADGGVFAGRVPQNEVLNGEDLDAAIDAMLAAAPPAAACAKDDK